CTRGGKTHGCPQARRRQAANILEHNGSAELAHDALHDRQAQSGAVLRRPAAPEERFEYPVDVPRRNPGPAVLDLQNRLAALAIDADIDAAAAWGEAHGVVD